MSASTAMWMVTLPVSFYLVGYFGDRIGIPDYGSDIPFSWIWTPLHVASLVTFFVAAFHVLIWISS